MINSITKNKQDLVIAGILSFLAIAALFLYQGKYGFSLWDEGYLWYGAQRVMVGEVPLRDFMAYDPGRYYWSAAWMAATGSKGIVALRLSVAMFQALGLFSGLFLIARSCRNSSVSHLLVSSLILVTWMYPRHKLFDISISIFIIGYLSYLIQKPVNSRFLVTGICVGLTALFGRNHAVYAVFGCLVTLVWTVMQTKSLGGIVKNSLYLFAGVIAGYAPMLLMILIIPGFAQAFWESIRFLFEVGNTNIPLPMPWPWLVQVHTLTAIESVRQVMVGLFFVCLPLAGMVSLIWVFWSRSKGKLIPPAVVASAFLILPYTQFAFSRADVNHLAQSIFPLLIIVTTSLSTQSGIKKWAPSIILLASSLCVMLPVQPLWQCIQQKNCATIEVSGDQLTVDPDTASQIALVRNLNDYYTPNGQSFLAEPYWPGAYALLERKSPVWEIFALFPRSNRFEKIEIERIRQSKPRFVIILDLALDGHEEMRFKNTHPQTNQFIVDNFDFDAKLSRQPILVYLAKDIAN